MIKRKININEVATAVMPTLKFISVVTVNAYELEVYGTLITFWQL
jgi:hypothetical protein